MANAVMASAPDLWGAGIRRAASASDAAEPLVAAARGHASSAIDLAAAYPALVIALGIGLALWLVGDRLFRPAASLAGAIAGALMGLAISSSWNGETLGGVPAPYAAIGLGSLLGLAIGAAMYRLAVGAAAALALAGVAGAIAGAVALHEPAGGTPERPETIAEASRWRDDAHRLERVSFDPEGTLGELRAAANSAGSALRQEWEAIPGEARSMILAASLLGCVLGFAVGVLRPRTSGPAVAALAGSALWIGATTALLVQAGRDLPPPPTSRPGAWLTAWLLVALVGFAVQRRVFRPRALLEKSEPE
jgi:hypothetical protein